MEHDARNREINAGGWRIEPIGGWSAAPRELIEDAVRHAVQAIEGAEGCLYHHSRHAVTYLTQIVDPTGNALELFVKTYGPPRGLLALKEVIRGGRAGNVIRMTGALNRAGFATPPLLLTGAHGSGRAMLASARAEGFSLPDFIASSRHDQSPAGKRTLLRALGAEVARLHRAGFIHGDLTPYNVFVVLGDSLRFIFLDHDRTRRGFPAGRRYRQLRNLVQLGRFDLPGLSNTDRMRVFNAYAAGLAIMRRWAMARRVARMLAARRRRDAK